jgi:prepilin-type N-terminal cleavage/methylation domain-containing protein
MGQNGDTLVEVLISILIVSMILTGAYVTTNRSTLRVIDSQEHAQALKLAESQLELIRQSAAASVPNILDRTTGDDFCMVGVTITDANNTGCKIGCSLFDVKVEWDSIATKTRAYEQLSYRLYR